VLLHFALHTVAFLKVFTGNVGAWAVTRRTTDSVTPKSSLRSPLLGPAGGRVFDGPMPALAPLEP